jgi:fatty-acyl-CoA synthase
MNGSSLVSRLAVFFGVGAPFLVLAASFATTFGVVDYATGFDLITLRIAAGVALIGVVLGLVALVSSLRGARGSALLAVIALLAGGLTLAGCARVWMLMRSNPPIHDVSTSWDDPVLFSRELTAARAEAHASNPVENDPRVPASAGAPWGGMRVADVNVRECPGAKPIMRGVDADQAAKALKRAGYTLTGQADFRVEGTRQGYWFGGGEDVAARIRPDRTDIRSVSRAGLSDLGRNCKAVTAIVQDLSR